MTLDKFFLVAATFCSKSRGPIPTVWMKKLLNRGEFCRTWANGLAGWMCKSWLEIAGENLNVAEFIHEFFIVSCKGNN